MSKYLKHTFLKHPLMKVEDFLKLIYQAEYGSGHLSRAADVWALIDECACVQKYEVPLFEEISDKMCRINLGACQKQSIGMQTVSAVVAKSAKSDGSLENLTKRCDEFLQLVQEKFIHLAYYATKNKVVEYLKQPYHGRHSPSYRQNYDPHYRVALTEHAQLLPLLSEIDRFCEKNLVCFVAIDGNACSGKSTVARRLQEYYPDSCIIHCDDFFLPKEKRSQERLDEIAGNVHYERLEDVLKKAKINQPFVYERYDCSSDTYQKVAFTPKRLVIVEGTYALRENLKDFYDVKCRLTIKKDTQQARLVARNPMLMKQFNDVWLPQEERYFQNYKFENTLLISMDKL